MAEQFLTLMADLDDDAQRRLSGWYDALKAAGFTGTQTPGLPYHISLSTFPLELEEEAKQITLKAAAAAAPVDVHFSHIGLFAGGRCDSDCSFQRISSTRNCSGVIFIPFS